MNLISIRYRFTLENGSQSTFELELDGERLVIREEKPEAPPSWTDLTFQQCSHCPLTPENYPHCPPALDLVPVVKSFNEILSYDTVHVEIKTKERRILQETSAQSALGSLMGLVIATSACPYTAFLKPMARFHLPLASEEETVYRAVGTYLIAQYFLQSEGKKTGLSLNGLHKITNDIHQINIGLTNRLREACGSDAPVNAVILLDIYSKSLNYIAKDSLREIRHLFDPFFDQLKMTVPP